MSDFTPAVIPLFTGESRPGPVALYLKRSFATLAELAYEGSVLEPDKALLDKAIRDHVIPIRGTNGAARKAEHALTTGQTCGGLYEKLLLDRVQREIGDELVTIRQEYGFALTPGLQLNPPLLCSAIPPHLFFNEAATRKLDKEAKIALLYHELAHKMLGHLTWAAYRFSDWSPLEHDADYVGGIVSGKPHKLADALATLLTLNGEPPPAQSPKTAPDWQAIEAQTQAALYKEKQATPGQNEVLDKEIAVTVKITSTALKHEFRMSQRKYPSFAGRIEELCALDKQLALQDGQLALSRGHKNQREDIIKEREKQGVASRYISRRSRERE